MSAIDQNATTEPPGGAEPELASVGRYTLKELIGAGGMGRVYAADDPELGRTVAVKLIRSERPSAQARARLLREAQALARVRHPNVVTVHDAGTEGDTVFVAMELVDAPNAAAWLAEEPRTWREILAAYIAAGCGLAAAHAAGIVHRDFKPENMLVADDRVVVVDFGLARAGGEVDETSTTADRLVDMSLTMTGERVGTPLYMSPEQRAGEVITAQSDQYSFCVALWLALHGVPPPEAGTQQVPAWIDRALKRGLAENPSERWPSMNALLQALGRDPVKRRRQIAATIGLLVVGAGVSAAAMRDHGDPCTNAAERLAGVWDEARQQAIGAAFGASNVTYAADTWARTRGRLDAHAGRWRDMYTEACRATRVEGRQSEAMMDLRMDCLEDHRSAFRALGDVWLAGMKAPAVEHAIAAADGLGDLSDCANTRALADHVPMPPSATTAVAVARTRERIRAIQSMRLAYKLVDAKAAIPSVLAEAAAIGWPQVQAEAAKARADVLSALQEPRQPELLEAVRLGFAAHADKIAADALVQLTAALATDEKTIDRAGDMATVAEAVVQRVGNDDSALVQLMRYRGEALRIKGNAVEARAAFLASYNAAVEKLGKDSLEALYARLRLTDAANLLGDSAEANRIGEENLAAMIRIYGPVHPTVGNQLNTLGNAAANRSEHVRALEYFARAQVVFEKVTGPDAIPVALVLRNIALSEVALGRLENASAHVEHALEILEHKYGPDNAEVGRALDVVAQVRRKQGRFAEARVAAERSLALRQKIRGPGHYSVSFSYEELGFEAMARGDTADALAMFGQELELRRKTLGADHVFTLLAECELANALQTARRCAEALPKLESTIARLYKTGSDGEAFLSVALTVRAACGIDTGRPTGSVEMVTKALVILDKIKASPVDHGGAHWQLARALDATGDRKGAIAAARLADSELAGDADGAHDRVAVEAWLKTH